MLAEILHLFMAAENTNAGDHYNYNTINIINFIVDKITFPDYDLTQDLN